MTTIVSAPTAGHLRPQPRAYRYTIVLVAVLLVMAGFIVAGLVWHTRYERQQLQLLNDYHLASAELSSEVEREAANVFLRERFDLLDQPAEIGSFSHWPPSEADRRHKFFVEAVDEALHNSTAAVELLKSNEKQFGDARTAALLDRLDDAANTLRTLVDERNRPTGESHESMLLWLKEFRVRADQFNRYHLAAYETLKGNRADESERLKVIFSGILVIAVLISGGLVLIILSAIKRGEAALLKSEARISEVLAIAPEAVITMGDDMNIQLFNKGAERIFGYKAEEMIGRPMELLMPEHLRTGHRAHIARFETSPDTYKMMDQRTDILAIRKDGTEFPAAASVSKLRVGGEKVFTVILKDVTERRQADEDRRLALIKAEEASQAKSEFLATMSHELRTPLNAIIGFSEMMTNQFLGPLGSPRYQEYANDILNSSDHLLHLVNDILDLSAIEAGRQTLAKENLEVDEIADDCSRFVTSLAGAKGIRFVQSVPENLPSLRGDRRAVKQVLLNLLTNAVKFTPDGGEITLTANVVNGSHTFMVRDNGRGIDPELLSQVTEPFVRGETDPHRAQEGSGLGLAIAKSLVALHEGELKIDSEFGKGTTVTVTLPSELV